MAEGRYGLRIEEDPVAARAELEQTVLEVANRDAYLKDHPPVITWPGGQFRGGNLPAGHNLRHLVADAHTSATGDVLTVSSASRTGATYGSTPAPAYRPCTTVRVRSGRPMGLMSRCPSLTCW